MEYLIWAVTLWLMVFIFIPVSRFRQLWLVAVLSPLLLFIMNYSPIWGITSLPGALLPLQEFRCLFSWVALPEAFCS